MIVCSRGARKVLYRGRKKIKKYNLYTTKNYIYFRHTPLSVECKNLFKQKNVCTMTVSLFRVFCIFKVFKKKIATMNKKQSSIFIFKIHMIIAVYSTHTHSLKLFYDSFISQKKPT